MKAAVGYTHRIGQTLGAVLQLLAAARADGGDKQLERAEQLLVERQTKVPETAGADRYQLMLLSSCCAPVLPALLLALSGYVT